MERTRQIIRVNQTEQIIPCYRCKQPIQLRFVRLMKKLSPHKATGCDYFRQVFQQSFCVILSVSFLIMCWIMPKSHNNGNLRKSLRCTKRVVSLQSQIIGNYPSCRHCRKYSKGWFTTGLVFILRKFFTSLCLHIENFMDVTLPFSSSL